MGGGNHNKKLLYICEKFARENDMIFNAKKTLCMCIQYKKSLNMSVPNVMLNGNNLKWVSDHKYLGVHICDDFTDDMDLKRQMKQLYGKGNILIRKFGKCSDEVKVSLFQSYCNNMYCCALWNKYNVSSYKSLNVAHNNVFRHLLQVSGPCSISQLFVNYGIDHFSVLL